MSARLDDFGDVLTRNDLGKLMNWSLRTIQDLQKKQRDLEIQCLPVAIPGFPNRFEKTSVRRWLRIGAPQIEGRRKQKASQATCQEASGA
jgi:hypothetical protein